MHGDPVIVACARTAIGRSHAAKGVFRRVRADELAAAAVRAAVDRATVDPATIDDVLLGAVKQHGELGGNVARAVALLAGIPFGSAAATVNRLCGSGLEAIRQACHAIAAGEADVQVAGGVEHMHHLPMESLVDFHPMAFAASSRGAASMGLTAEFLAGEHGISRKAQEAFALASHRKAHAAAEAGLFDREIVTTLGHDESGGLIPVRRDQSIRNDASLEAMAELPPAFVPKYGTITAATSSPLSDGAAAVVVMRRETARRLGLAPLARVVATTVAGVAPAEMGTGPIAAVGRLLARTGVSASEIDLVELNEAFAAQAIHCIRSLRLDESRVNVHGGAIAVGHPLGASGARIATTLVHAMHARSARLGLATMCIGFGQGIAVLLERVDEAT
jgi:acetyl-CoA acyltransferase